MRPERPSPDVYDGNCQIRPHFSKTPGLTPIPQGHHYNDQDNGQSVVLHIKYEVRKIYTKFNLERCHYHGLYFAGSPYWTHAPDREKTMLLVMELTARDIQRWREFDAEVRKLLEFHDLGGIHGVCLRYYQVWDDGDFDVEQGSGLLSGMDALLAALYLMPFGNPGDFSDEFLAADRGIAASPESVNDVSATGPGFAEPARSSINGRSYTRYFNNYYRQGDAVFGSANSPANFRPPQA